MTKDLLVAVQDYVEENIGAFHEKRLDTVRNKRMDDVLRRKNPYLFRAKEQTATQLVESIMNSFISSQEETLFGEFMEGVAVFVAGQTMGGYKPSPQQLTGIDLVFEKDNTVYVVDIKSGPNWGNSSQVTKMYLHFREAITRLKAQHPGQSIIPINGCMYGKDSRPKKTGKIKQASVTVDEITYWKLCGQDFWHFISANRELYVEIIKPLGYQAKQRNEDFQIAYGKFISRLTREFFVKYCHESGEPDWGQLTRFVSESATDDIPLNFDQT